MTSIPCVFVYGTLMTGFANHQAVLGKTFFHPQAGSIPGLLYHMPEGYPALVPGDDWVRGELLTFPPDEVPVAQWVELLAAMDELEGYIGPGDPHNLYNRETVSVQVEHTEIQAQTYVYVDTERACREGIVVPEGNWRKYLQGTEDAEILAGAPRLEGQELRVVVDADACPRGAMDILHRLQREYGFRLITVASFHHNIPGTGHASEHVTVGDAPDEADLAVANRVRKDDVVITQDWGLAALVLGKGARVLSPLGHRYRPERIDFMLDERHTKAKVRRGGGRTRGPRARSRADDDRFAASLRALLDQRRD